MRTIQVCDYIEKKLCDLYDSEHIFDKFELKCSPCSKYMFTGSYNGNFHIIDVEGTQNMTNEASFNNKRGKPCGDLRYYGGKKLQPIPGSGPTDFSKRVLQGAWHPTENIVAAAQHNCIYLFNEEKKGHHK